MAARIENTDELAARAREMYVPGVVGYKAVASNLGVSQNTVRRWLVPGFREKDNAASLRAKRRRTGVCVDCGATTRYNGHGDLKVSDRCGGCSAVLVGLAKRGRGSNQVRLVALLAGGPRRFTEIALILNVNRNVLGVLLNRSVRDGLVVRVTRGVYALPRRAESGEVEEVR